LKISAVYRGGGGVEGTDGRTAELAESTNEILSMIAGTSLGNRMDTRRQYSCMLGSTSFTHVFTSSDDGNRDRKSSSPMTEVEDEEGTTDRRAGGNNWSAETGGRTASM
jgi:hypothetical protein